ncbi:MAG TPA: hypothetical protein V6D18_19450 [Thermosynechococcaceae cyanobacterium]
MQYPLEFTFKFWSLSPKIIVTDAQGQVVLFVKQKLFRLKEVINICADVEQKQLLYQIKADRIIDFSARYNFIDPSGRTIGAVKRRGLKSFWHAHYDILNGDTPAFTIQEENPWVKVVDSLLSQIPLVGMFSGYFFNPVYVVSRVSGGVVMRLEKRPSFLSRVFIVKQVDRLNSTEETEALLSLLMMLLLERNRG